MGVHQAAEPPGGLRAVSRPQSPDEAAADNAARGVMSPGTAESLSGTDAWDVLRVPRIVDQVLSSPGEPLGQTSRAGLQQRLGHDLGDVRIHSGPHADIATLSIGSVAFTAGRHVVLGRSVPPVDSPSGMRLMAHELTHVAQGRQEGTDGPLRRVRAVPESTVDQERTLRIQGRLAEFAASAPAATAEAPPSDRSGQQADPALVHAREIAAYLVLAEELTAAAIEMLLEGLAEVDAHLLTAIALGGRLFLALGELGVSLAQFGLDMTTAVGGYLLLTIRDTLAGDFVENPTALAIVLRTLLTLIPGVDTVADVEDIVANLLYGALDPEGKLTSIGWWFSVVLALIGLFPEFGSAIKGTVQLTVRGIGAAGGAGMELVAPHLRRLLGVDWVSLAKVGIDELLATVASWGPWALAKFGEYVDLVIRFLGSALATVGGAALATLLDAFRKMKDLAAQWVPKAVDDILARLGRSKDELTDAAEESFDDLDEATKVIARGRGLDPGEVERQLTDALSPNDRVTKELLAARGTRPTTTASEAVARRLRGTALVNQVVAQTSVVARAFADPKAFGAAMRELQTVVASLSPAEIAEEAQRLASRGVVTPLQRDTAAYVAAVRKLAQSRGTGVVEIVHRAGDDLVNLVRTRGESVTTTPVSAAAGVMKHDDFMEHVIQTGDMIVDYAFIRDPHSIITHVLHDLVADAALKATGKYPKGAVGYRQLLGELQATTGERFTQANIEGSFSAGTSFWVATFDTTGGIGQPEILGPALRRALGLPEPKPETLGVLTEPGVL